MKSLLPRTVTDPLLPSGMVGNDRLGISDLDADHCGSRRRHTIARQDQTLHSAQALALPWLHLLQDVSVRRLSPNSCRPTSIVPRRTPEYSPRVISRQAWGAEFQHTCMPTGGQEKITEGRQPHSHSALSTDLWAGYLLWADHSPAADPDQPSLNYRQPRVVADKLSHRQRLPATASRCRQAIAQAADAGAQNAAPSDEPIIADQGKSRSQTPCPCRTSLPPGRFRPPCDHQTGNNVIS
jgi:hypothetical protein